MDGDRFDSLTRAFGSGRSRRGLLKALGVSALGAAGLSRLGSAEAKGSNRACAQFCADALGAGTFAAFQCTTDGARRQGPCMACGNDINRLCNGTCVDLTSDVNNCGSCGNAGAGDACNAPACAGGACGTTPLTGAACTINGHPGACSSGACVANPVCTTIATCATSADCGSGQSCQNGACFTACPDGGCSHACAACICSDSTDNSDPYCHDRGFDIGGCQSNADCPAGSVCDARFGNGPGAALCMRPCPV